MRLVVDTNVLVAELLRNRGVALINSQNFELFLAEKMKNEVQYELQKRVSIMVNKAKFTPEQGQFQLEVALGIIDRKIVTFPLSYSGLTQNNVFLSLRATAFAEQSVRIAISNA